MHANGTDKPCMLDTFQMKQTIMYVCVTAVGWRASNTQFTFVLARVGSGLCTRQVVTATRSITVMNTISILWAGTH